MNFLQTIKDAFAKVFPLHLNATVVALEDALADAHFAGSCLRSYIEVKQEQIDRAVEANVAYRRENMHMVEAIKMYQKELEAEYAKSLPERIVMPATGEVLHDGYRDEKVFRLRLPEFRMDFRIGTGTLSPLFAEHLADYLSRQCADAFKAKALETLLNETCKGN